MPILSLITFLPLAGALLFIFFPKEQKNLFRVFALLLTLVTFIISLTLYFQFDSGTADPQFVEKAEWIGYGIQYHVGIDGISLLLILLTTFLFPIAILSSWNYIQDKVKEWNQLEDEIRQELSRLKYFFDECQCGNREFIKLIHEGEWDEINALCINCGGTVEIKQ